MLKEAIEKILELKRDTVVEINSRKYSTSGLDEVTDPVIAPMAVSTLASLVLYVRENVDGLERRSKEGTTNGAPWFVQIVSPDEVVVRSPVNFPWFGRHSPIIANRANHGAGFEFNKYHDSETFIVALLSKFQDSGDRAAIMELVGNIKSSNVKTQADDGVTQTVETRAGLVLSGVRAVPNPVTLTPWRTFAEIPQPEGAFVLRLKETALERSGLSDKAPAVGLFEADGGAWKLKAIENIRVYLRGQLPKEVHILA